jgi:hypothetical protein
MPYDLKHDVENALIECDYTDVITFEQRKNSIDEGLVLLKGLSEPKILINLIAAKMDISRDEKKDLAAYISEQLAAMKVKTAFLIRCEQTEREEVDAAVVEPENFNSKVFYSRAEAVAWLNS